ncbi:unnamed protein product, partial [Musa textilis]
PKGFRKFAGRFVGSSRSLPRKIGACQRSSRELAKIIVESESLPGVRRMVSEGSSEDRRKFAGSSTEEDLTCGLYNSLEMSLIS